MITVQLAIETISPADEVLSDVAELALLHGLENVTAWVSHGNEVLGIHCEITMKGHLTEVARILGDIWFSDVFEALDYIQDWASVESTNERA